ncbi:unnamed protein product [Heterosigma akashiwo]|eukprot:CAMPEP_0194586094 /NCGR_PEP_ID=MMETSP0292-20121207/18200_1 /TAXON_ID=39354 /ORGANISM="Heterosigma akashiwo, Strain CCMP2393" /LENGTH=103 /DNA_ID=CAMNT_0039441781 /DNA_START=12 /DNA_END=323 /DNA_ORIENTATION=+
MSRLITTFGRFALSKGSLFRASTQITARSFATVPYAYGLHRSNAEELIAKVAPIEVDGHIAVCDGGGGALGHPLEYIQLDTKDLTAPQTCKYCGLRYVGKHHH